MDIHAWNRKDALPKETIERFQNVLQEVGINTRVIKKESYQNYWYSNRIEIDGLTTIVTNGKGITESYAMASAYGEFLERLQSGILTNYLFPLMESKKQDKNLNIIDIVSSFKKFFSNVCSWINTDDLNEIVDISVKKGGICLFESILGEEKYVLSPYLISVLCGSNGIAAGNTFFEAFVQGTSEIFERYVTQFIYKEKYDDLFAVINESAYKGLNSYSLIQAIEKRNYRVFVIDCSLGGKLPVIGTLVFDPSMTKYYFKLGSDADVDIALQRCITEVFQGNSFDLNFRMRMNDILAQEPDEDDFWYGDNRKYEHTKAEIDGTGCLPRAFLNCLSNTVANINGFIHQQKSNKEAAKFMIQCCKQFSGNIVVANLTSLGVPCLRILIPDMCESFYYPGEDILKPLKSISRIRALFRNGELKSKTTLECMIHILEYLAYIYDFNMVKLLGVLTNDVSDPSYLYNPYLFTAYLALYHKEFEIAMKYFKISGDNARTNDQIKNLDVLIVKAMREKISESELLNFIKPIDKSGKMQREITFMYDIMKNGMKMPTCPNCEACFLQERCAYKIWEPISNRLQSMEKIDKTDDFYYFLEVLRKE